MQVIKKLQQQQDAISQNARGPKANRAALRNTCSNVCCFRLCLRSEYLADTSGRQGGRGGEGGVGSTVASFLQSNLQKSQAKPGQGKARQGAAAAAVAESKCRQNAVKDETAKGVPGRRGRGRRDKTLLLKALQGVKVSLSLSDCVYA